MHVFLRTVEKFIWEVLREDVDKFYTKLVGTGLAYFTLARDYTLFKLLALAGLRINKSVILDVKYCKFDLGEKSKLHIRFGKGLDCKSTWVLMLGGLDELFK